MEQLLKHKNADEKQVIKTKEIANLNHVGVFDNAQYGLRIEILNTKESKSKERCYVEILARAWKNGNPIGFGKDGSVEIERFRIFNPPILVDDPNGMIIRSWTDHVTGQPHERRLREDPLEATRQTLAHTISLVGKEDTQVTSGKIGNTTSTFYPDPNVEVTSVDGSAVRIVASETFATIRGGAGTASSDTAASQQTAYIESTTTTDQYGRMDRSMFLFDTSAIPDVDVVNSATLSLYLDTKTSGLGGTLEITSSNPASNTAVVNADYAVANFGSTKFATGILFANVVNAAYNDFALNASGLSNISKTGVSKFATRNSFDVDNTAPTWVSATSSGAVAVHADTAGTTSDPKLVVVHTATTFIPQVLII